MIPYSQTEHARRMSDLHSRVAPVEAGAKLLDRAAVLFARDAGVLALINAARGEVDARLEGFDAEFETLDRNGAVLVQQVAA